MTTLPEEARPRVETPFRSVYGNVVGDAWLPPVIRRYFDNHSPIDGEISPTERANILNRVAQLMEDNLERPAATAWDVLSRRAASG